MSSKYADYKGGLKVRILVGCLVGLLSCLPFGVWAQVSKSATLTWTANTEVDLAGYKVYRTNSTCATATVMPPVLATLGKVVTYVDPTIPSTWFIVSYWITAIDTAPTPNESLKSNCVEKTFYVDPVAPVLVPGAVTLTSITVSWNAVGDGAGNPAKYNLRYAVAPALTNGGWGTATSAVCTSLTATSCTITGLPSGVQHEFQIVSYRTTTTSSVFSPLSAIVKISTTAPDVIAPAAPQNLQVASITGLNALLSWSSVVNAVDYEVRRLNTSNSTWVSLDPQVVTVSNSATVPLPSYGTRRFQICARNSVAKVCNANAGVWAVRQ